MLKKILTVAVFTACLPAVMAGQSLTGAVYDSVSGYPLEGVIVSVPAASLDAETGPDGSFTIPGLASGEHVILFETWGFATIGMRIQVLMEDARDASVGIIRMSPAATVTGTVVDSTTGIPLLDVEVRVPDLGLAAETDDRGAFALEGVPGGDVIFEFRRLGYVAAAVQATLTIVSPTELSLGSVTLAATAVLPTVEVVGDEAQSSIMPNFDELKRVGNGRYITAEDIEKMNPRNTSDVIRRLTGFRSAAHDGLGAGVGQVSGGRASSCVTRFYVDGIRSSATSIDMIQPRALAGIELYSGPASIPVRYQSPNEPICGLIIFWTKDSASRNRGGDV